MIAKSQQTISESVASEIRRNFFTKTFETELSIMSSHNETSVEANDIAADKEVESFNGHCISLKLSLLGQIWLHIQSDGLAQEFSNIEESCPQFEFFDKKGLEFVEFFWHLSFRKNVKKA